MENVEITVSIRTAEHVITQHVKLPEKTLSNLNESLPYIHEIIAYCGDLTISRLVKEMNNE